MGEQTPTVMALWKAANTSPPDNMTADDWDAVADADERLADAYRRAAPTAEPGSLLLFALLDAAQARSDSAHDARETARQRREAGEGVEGRG